MTDYRAIYNHIVQTDQRYNLAENSPGLRAVIEATDALGMISGRSLDIGCGVGFVIEFLSGPSFDLVTHGVDVSDQSIERAQKRLAHLPGARNRLFVLSSQEIPFDDDFFSLVTCFDMLEHLDLTDIEMTLKEAHRVLRPGGTFFGSVSCRAAGIVDQFGDNLHRTVQTVDWWLEKLKPERAEYDGIRQQMKFWKRNPLVRRGE
jgi:ubiquinone/menaquinone biosynthesis C-methylase UbiE